MIEEKYLSIPEVAERLGVNEKTVYKYLRVGQLKGEKNPVGGKWLRIKETDLEMFITGKPTEINRQADKKDGESDAIQKAEDSES